MQHQNTQKEKYYVLFVQMRKGLSQKITNICYKHQLNIVQNNEFVDHRTGRFLCVLS